VQSHGQKHFLQPASTENDAPPKLRTDVPPGPVTVALTYAAESDQNPVSATFGQLKVQVEYVVKKSSVGDDEKLTATE
jgi:hypothetical protein